VAQQIQELYPEAYVCLSSQILPEWREFERCSTTTANAYLGPIIKRYLRNLHLNTTALGLPAAPRIMQSNGGIMSITAAADRAVYTLFSGPSAGVIGGQYLATAAGYQNLITFDMGGTSTDVSLVENGSPKYTTEKELNGVPLKIPMIDIHTVGAGGGSIAWIDSGGLLKVGPQSMGADPGPACYNLGGTEPTVTDMNVVLGRLNPEYLLGGQMRIRADLSRQVIQDKVAQPLGLSLEEAAAGILTIVNTNMVLATRLISIQRGYDPRDFVLVAFGGAGPLHAGAIAQELNITKILIPPSPGTVCALGLLVADTRADYVLTRKFPVREADLGEINTIFTRLEMQAEAWLEEEKIPPERRMVQRTVDMRYSKQNYELSVPALSGFWDEASREEMNQRFHAVHRKTYGYDAPEEPAQFITFRVTAIGVTTRPLLKAKKSPYHSPHTGDIPQRAVYFQESKGFQRCPVFNREWLSPGEVLSGPAIVEQMDATTVIHPGHQATVDPYGNLLIELSHR
jgi:N-methylhydantoinase A